MQNDETIPADPAAENSGGTTTPAPLETPAGSEKPKPPKGRGKGKGRKKRSTTGTDDQTLDPEEKPKRTPQLHTDEEIRGMLAALQADYPGMSYKDIVKLALRLLCDKTAYLPPIRLARIEAETLRIQAGTAAVAEEACKKLIRAIIKAKLDPETQARLTDELEREVAKFGETRRTMMRQAAIPMAPNLPGDVGVGIDLLEHEMIENPHKSVQATFRTCVQILRAYRPPELDLPEDLRDPFENEE